MRLVVGALAIFLTSSVFADDKPATNDRPAETKPGRAKLTLRLIRILPDTHQAALLDRTRSTHIVAAVGDTVSGYTVEDIDEDEVTLSRNGVQVVLAVPDPTPPNPRADTPVVKPAPGTKAPEDPYNGGTTPEDPYAGPPSWIDEPAAAPAAASPSSPSTPATASPPSTSVATPAGTISSSPASAPPASTWPASTAPTTPSTPAASDLPEAGAPLAASATSQPPAPPLAAATGTLSRREVDTALADFGVLIAAIRGSFTATGAQLDSVAAGSLFAKGGLRGGDLISSVNGRPLRSLDDAAELYARASTLRALTLQVVRAGKPTTLRVTIQ